MTRPMRAVVSGFASGWLAAGAAMAAAGGAPWCGLALAAVASALIWNASGAAVEMAAALAPGPSGHAPRAPGGSGEQGRAGGRARGADAGGGR